MMTRFIRYLLVLGFLASVSARINVEFDQERIESGKAFTMSIVVPVPELPASHGIPNIDDLQGFSLSSVDSVDERVNSFFTGRMQVRKYRFHLVPPKQDGAYDLPVSWEMDGNVRSLGKIRINVARPFDASALQVTLTPSKKTVYEGEQFSLTMGLATFENFQGGLNLSGIDLGNDFVAHRSDLAKLQLTRSSRPGVQLEASSKIAWLSAIRAGNLAIPPLKFKYQKLGAPKVVNKQMGNMSFSSVTQQPEEATAVSAPLQIQALPLPSEGRPTDFSGLVGQYTFEANVDRTDLQVGEALTLLIKIRGNGKPGSINDPKMPDFSEFRSVPPEAEITKTELNGVVWTERTMKIFLYPKKKGSFRIAPIRFSWFDHAKRKYVEASSSEFMITAEKGSITEAAASGGMSVTPVANTAQKKEIEQLGTDIRYIHEPQSLESQSQSLYRKVWYWLLLALPFVLAWASSIVYRKRHALLHDRGYQRRVQAHHALQAQWKEADALIAQNDTKAMLTLIERALLSFFGDLHNQEFTGLTRDQLQLALQKSKTPEQVITELLQLLNHCDQARFSPLGVSPDEGARLLQSAKSISEAMGRIPV